MRYADQYFDMALRYADVSVKQAVISPSALSLMYPPEGIAGCPRTRFIHDPRREHESEVRHCLQKGAYMVQVDFTEGRLGTTDDCGFSPFCDDTSTSRVTALAKIRPRVAGTSLADEILGVR